MTYNDLIRGFMGRARDVATVPLQGSPKWFWVQEDNGLLKVSSGREHPNSSTIHGSRVLVPEEFEAMDSLYERRCAGQPVALEAKQASQNQSYWYGVIRAITI